MKSNFLTIRIQINGDHYDLGLFSRDSDARQFAAAMLSPTDVWSVVPC
jgi:hypothetical protein